MNKKFKFPGWIPSPKCWLQSIVLFVGLLAVVSIMYFTSRLLAGPIEMITELPPVKILVLPIFWVGIFWAFLLPIFIFAHIYQFFWGKYLKHLPWWLPNHDSISEGGWSFAITLLSFSATMTIFSIFDPDLLNEASSYSETRSAMEGGFLSVVWFIFVAYLFHGKNLLSVPAENPKKPEIPRK